MRGVHPGAEARGIYSRLPGFLPLSHVYPYIYSYTILGYAYCLLESDIAS